MADSPVDPFFDKALAQSVVKMEIVAKYFYAWSKIAVGSYSKKYQRPVLFLDLFSGPGIYEDGTASTPVRVMQCISDHHDLSRWVHAQFNDANLSHIERLKANLAQMPQFNMLSFPPSFTSIPIDHDAAQLYDHISAPTLTFLDPCGYSVLSRELIAATTRKSICDGIFFFNYLSVNRAVSNPILQATVHPLFGHAITPQLAKDVRGRNPSDREDIIVQAFTRALLDVGVAHPLFFRFVHRDMDRTSHYLVFVSDHPLAHSIMKDVMAKRCSLDGQGVPTFIHDPRRQPMLLPGPIQPPLFDFAPQTVGSLDRLTGDLLRTFSGQTLSMEKIYEMHQFGTPYIKPNYKEVLRVIESRQIISAHPSAENRPIRNGVRTFGDKVVVTFPRT